MYCRKCGKEISPDDRYCSACGARLKEETSEVGKRRLFLLTLAGAVILLTAVGTMLFGGRTTLQPVEPKPVIQEKAEPETNPGETTGPREETQPEQTQTDPQETQRESVLLLTEETHLENGVESRLQYRYDDQGRLTRKDWGDGTVSEYTYHPGGKSTEERRSASGKLVEQVVCDPYGNPVERSDDRGILRNYKNTYDAQGRLTGVSVTGSDGLLMEQSSWYYGSDGSWDMEYTDFVDGAVHCHKYTSYDAQGEVTGQVQDLESGMDVQYQVDHYRDEYGNLERTICTSHDGDQFEETITEHVNICDKSGCVIEVEIYTKGRRIVGGETMELPRRLERSRTCFYDAAGRLVRQEDVGNDGSWKVISTWEYDTWGNLLQHTEGEDVHTYTYSAL